MVKIQDTQEVERWLSEGRTYAWMSKEYLRKYNIQIRGSAFSNYRQRHGLSRRINRDDDLIPWAVEPEHRWRYPLQMLRSVARQRAGFELRPSEKERVESFLRFLSDNDAVVAYAPHTEDGFLYVPREEGDEDIIRRPARKTTPRKNADGD